MKVHIQLTWANCSKRSIGRVCSSSSVVKLTLTLFGSAFLALMFSGPVFWWPIRAHSPLKPLSVWRLNSLRDSEVILISHIFMEIFYERQSIFGPSYFVDWRDNERQLREEGSKKALHQERFFWKRERVNEPHPFLICALKVFPPFKGSCSKGIKNGLCCT